MFPIAGSGSTSSPISLEVDGGEATLTQGFGGWETVSRPQRVALTRYVGNDPIGQSVPVLYDSFARSQDVEPRLQRLLLQSREKGGDNRVPTVWRLDGPIFYPEKRWVVSGLEFGEILRAPRPAPILTPGPPAIVVRQRLTISFLEYIDPDQIRVKRVKRTYRPKGKKRKIKANGRSIKAIAAEFYGTSEIAVARALGKAQKPPIRDIKKKLGKDREIRLPNLRV